MRLLARRPRPARLLVVGGFQEPSAAPGGWGVGQQQPQCEACCAAGRGGRLPAVGVGGACALSCARAHSRKGQCELSAPASRALAACVWVSTVGAAVGQLNVMASAAHRARTGGALEEGAGRCFYIISIPDFGANIKAISSASCLHTTTGHRRKSSWGSHMQCVHLCRPQSHQTQ